MEKERQRMVARAFIGGDAELVHGLYTLGYDDAGEVRKTMVIAEHLGPPAMGRGRHGAE